MNKKIYLLALWSENVDCFEDCSILCFESELARDKAANDALSRGFRVCCDSDFI